jgi:xanthine dehydrogenase accessory factor
VRDADTEVLGAAQRWIAAGHRVALATLARATDRAPRPLGSLLAVRDDGALAGSVSGGCVEETLAQDMCAGRLPPGGVPRLMRFGLHEGRVERVALPCGGGIEVVFEPRLEAGALPVLLAALQRGEPCLRHVCLDTGEISLHAGQSAVAVEFDGCNLRRRFGPAWRLLLVGAGDLSRCVAEMARALDARVMVCEPRRHWATGWDLDDVALRTDMPDEAFADLGVDGSTAVLALTHDPALDDLALAEALGSAAFYVGALGSRRNAARRRERLHRLGVAARDLDRLHSPAGLPLGGRSVPEIALSILADVTAVRHGVAAPVAPAAAGTA